MKAVVACLALLFAGCAELTPEESCRAICAEFQQCQIFVVGSTLRSGTSCEADCRGKIDARGAGCKRSASFLAECFQTYSCEGNDPACGTNAESFAQECG